MTRKGDLSRSTFLKSSTAATVGASALGEGSRGAGAAARRRRLATPTAVDVRRLKMTGRIGLSATPQWMKVLAV